MNLWIVTIGSSDVQLDSDKVNRHKGRTEKQRSDKVWQYWYDDIIKEECYDIPFEPKPAFKDSEEPYRIPPRILGIVYESSSEEVKEEIQTYLTFPLLKNFVEELKQLEPPEAIAVLLTDQSEIFQDDNKRRKPKCPYWQDTCKLEPIVKSYLRQKFPDAKIIPLILSAQEELGLDDWDCVLNFVRDKLDELDKLSLQPDTVYVSHQAGTPAISSAVQFVSLAKFRTDVKFLVSNEYTQETRPISRSNYLGAIQIQEAKALLDRYDYAGVRDILGLTKAASRDSKTKLIKHLLEAGIQWNIAEFHDFKDSLIKLGKLDKGEFLWWQSGYESAYLGWVRLKQGATVDALFHSFRAVEGTASLWAAKHFPKDTERNKKKGLQLKNSILNQFPSMKSCFQPRNSQSLKNQIGLYGKTLFTLLKEARTDWNTDKDMKLFCGSINLIDSEKDIFEWRNNLFHRLEGLQTQELFDAWDAVDENEWITRVIGCLNFLSQKQFKSLEEASWIAKVHQELEEAIASYKPE